MGGFGMLIKKGGICRNIAPERLAEYTEKGYQPVKEKKKAGDQNAGDAEKAKTAAGDNRQQSR